MAEGRKCLFANEECASSCPNPDLLTRAVRNKRYRDELVDQSNNPTLPRPMQRRAIGGAALIESHYFGKSASPKREKCIPL
jgi:hypothetical protein